MGRKEAKELTKSIKQMNNEQ